MLILLPSGIAAAKATQPLIIQPVLSRSKKKRHGQAKCASWAADKAAPQLGAIRGIT
jgi:hypothetical protein